MDRLWAPWRLDAALRPKPAGCFLCTAFADSHDRVNLIIERTPFSAVILNRYPYNNGHLLIAPLTHRAKPGELDDHQALDLQHLINKYLNLIQQRMKAEGFNVGLNLGSVAGAGLPGHLHWHLVPRWSGDQNFMPAFAATSVIPQSLEALYDLLTRPGA